MRIAIIGAGPAGIASAIFLNNFAGEIHLFEQNQDIGEKLKLTGGGRMNILNKNFQKNHFTSTNQNLKNNLFKSPLANQLPDLIKQLGINIVWDNEKAFPVSKNASNEVTKLSNNLSKQNNLTLRTNTKIEKITITNNNFALKIHNRSSEELFDKVIIATGGMLRFGENAQKFLIYSLPISLGHQLTDIYPALNPIIIKNNPFKTLTGLSFCGELFSENRKISSQGNILFTHQGISGPAVLDFSLSLPDLPKNYFYISFINKHQKKDFLEQFEIYRKGKHKLRQLINKYLPLRLTDFILNQCSIDPKINIADINKNNFHNLTNTLFNYKITNFMPAKFSQAWTTRGGINISEINMATLESKFHQGLYFAGEIIDINGVCGGYNLGFAILSAKIATDHINIFKKRHTN